MSETAKIIEEGDRILLDVTDTDRRMYKRLVAFLSENTIGGKVSITSEELANLEDIIYQEVKDSDYEETIKRYLALFSQLEASISKDNQKYNKIKASEINKLWSDSDLKAKLSEKVLTQLGKQGVQDVLVKRIANVVRDISYYNLTISDAIDKLTVEVLDKKATRAFLETTAIDTLSQYEGAMNDLIRDTYKLEDLFYIGNPIENSRPFCTHLMQQYKGRLTKTQLEKELKEYCPEGVPSKDKITYDTVSGDKHKSAKGAGMIEGTRYSNFGMLRGGYRCRHTAIWVNFSDLN